MTALVVAALSAREVSRRRTALLLVITLPLWFYLVRRDQTGQSVRMLTLGIGWAVSTLTLFVVNASRGVDPRLRLSGASTAAVIGGRLLAMTGGGVILALGYWVLTALDQDLDRPAAVALIMVLAAVLAAPLGGLVAALLPRELEGALALLSICAVQMLADPAGLVAKLMPFWSAREIGTYAIDATAPDYLWRGLAHAAVTWLICAGGTWAIFAWRLRLPRYPEP
ncbi:hypothetical protein BJ973_008674 [Actinoplanes tereljensis]|uniref:Uncharacterized protein n=1 Tax=Paractinoplanes tereljensis TaxID=571912 RepID=A0A919TRG9_9ACTN|nr:hypothetical protein [Actinoplanes tereljensis]GIF18365.1 hypothetical protein Ate02nite_10950 [Actinoplanes tereljensis]